MSARRVLVVDDDATIADSVAARLRAEGFAVSTAADGPSAVTACEREQPDLVVLDVMLPDADGLAVCRRLRETGSMPIVLLTARDTVPDRVAGLDSGADDYLVKPFALDELLARVRAQLRRGQQRTDKVLHYADLRLDLETCEATRFGEPLRLTPREFELLASFLRHPRQVLSREQLCQRVWGFAFEGESNFVDVAVKELRKKLEADGRPRLIQTVRGYGYALREE